MESLLRRDDKLCDKNFTKHHINIIYTRNLKITLLSAPRNDPPCPAASASDSAHAFQPMISEHSLYIQRPALKWLLEGGEEAKRDTAGKGCCTIYKVLKSLVNLKSQMF